VQARLDVENGRSLGQLEFHGSAGHGALISNKA
jgi:hypothetical protein